MKDKIKMLILTLLFYVVCSVIALCLYELVSIAAECWS